MIKQDIIQRRGSKSIISFEAPGNLNGHEISFVVKSALEITDTRVVDKNSLRDGEVGLIYNNERNCTAISVILLEEDTYSLNAGNYYYDIDDLASSVTIAAGLFILNADVQTPFDNLEALPRNCERAIIAMPGELEDNSLLFKVTEEGKGKFTGLSISVAKETLGITQLGIDKVDKQAGMGLSELSFTQQLKSNYDTAYTERHSHSNKSSLDNINQNLAVNSTPQFNQLGLGRASSGTWSLSLQSGLTLKSGAYIDWEGGNARIRENGYNIEFNGFDGAGLVTALRVGSSGNISYKPLITNGQAYKVITVTGDTTLTQSDHIVLVSTSASDKTITLPVSGINDGTVYFIKKIDSGSGKVIIRGASGYIDGQANVELDSEFYGAEFIKNGSNYFIMHKPA